MFLLDYAMEAVRRSAAFIVFWEKPKKFVIRTEGEGRYPVSSQLSLVGGLTAEGQNLAAGGNMTTLTRRKVWSQQAVITLPWVRRSPAESLSRQQGLSPTGILRSPRSGSNFEVQLGTFCQC